MKKLRLFALGLCILLMLPVMTGCASGFLVEEEGVFIQSITHDLMEDGSTRITITYTDEEMKPSVFYIPKGQEGVVGKDGVGIHEITYDHDEEENKTFVTITYTDVNQKPTTFPIPDGVSVTGVTTDVDTLTGEKYIIFSYSNGDASDRIILPSGADGIGILTIDQEVNPEDKSVKLTINLTDGSFVDVMIPPPQTGNGIASIATRYDDEYYWLDIAYTNGTTQSVNFPRPEDPNSWSQSSRMPGMSEGKDGDFVFDSFHKKIYTKVNGAWILAVDFTNAEETYIITFDLNDDGDAYMPDDAQPSYAVEKGSNFASGGYDIPVPVRDGYTFKGWYTKKQVNLATMSSFTDLTAVYSDLKLYALWEKNP